MELYGNGLRNKLSQCYEEATCLACFGLLLYGWHALAWLVAAILYGWHKASGKQIALLYTSQLL